MSTGDPYCGICGGMIPCACYTRIGGVGGVQIQPIAQPVWIGPNTGQPYPHTAPVSNPPAIPYHNIDNGFLNNWAMQSGVTVRRHKPLKAGQLVMINWALIEGTDAILYEDQAPPFIPTTNTISIHNRKQLCLFKGKESLIVLDDCNDFASEAKVAWDEKIGFVNAYLLLPIEEEDEQRLGARKRAATKKTADRALGDVGVSDPPVKRDRSRQRSRSR